MGLFQMFRCIYNGFIDAGGVVFFVFIAYASIGLIISTGAFNGLVAGLLKILKGKSRAMIIPIFITLIGLASSTIGVFEEMFPFIPIFVGIAIAMGYDAIVGLAIVALGTGLGYSGALSLHRGHGAKHRRTAGHVRLVLPHFLPYLHDCGSLCLYSSLCP